MSQINKIPTLYNPANLTKEEINESFVIREKELDILLSEIKRDNMKYPPQHFLVQGIRGTGKTTLLLKLYYSIKDDNKLNKWLYPVMFHEEQYSISKLYKLWISIIEKLEFEERINGFEGLTERANELLDSEDYEQKCFDLLIQALYKQNKKVLLLVDNFTELLGKFKLQEQQRLREVLITCNAFRIIGCSTLTLEYYFNYDAPFYEFFKIIQLKGLDKDDTIKFLLKLGEVYGHNSIKKIVEEKSGKINALRILTGGIPRTIVLLFEIFVDDVNGDSTKNLESIIDRVTPLYKDRMDNLPTQQQEIVDTLALNWDAMPVKDVVKKIHTESKIISAQFNQLEKLGIIEKKKTSTKNHFYQISERFFNIWYLMRFGGRKSEKKVIWLVRFLETCFDKSDLIKKAESLMGSIGEGKIYEKHAFMMTSALYKTKIPHYLKNKLISTTKSYLKNQSPEFVRDLPNTDEENVSIAKELIDKEKYKDALKILLPIEEPNGYVINLISTSYYFMKDYENAKKYLLMGVKKGNSVSMQNLAFLLENIFKKIEEAEKYYLLAIKNGNDKAMFGLGSLYETEYEDFKKAEKYYLMAIEKGQVDAMNNLALLYETEYKDYKKAEKYYLMAIEKGQYDAMYNLALLYETEYKDYKKAEKYYLMAIKSGNEEAVNNQAVLYHNELKEYIKAEKYYLMAIEKGNEKAMYNLALLYKTELNDLKKSKEYFSQSYEKGIIHSLYFLSMINYEENELVKAVEYYNRLLDEINVEDIIYGLQSLTFSKILLKSDIFVLSGFIFEKNKDIKNIFLHTLILLWNNKFDEMYSISKDYLEKIKIMKEHFETYSFYLILLLSKKQFHYVKNLFDMFPEAKDIFKPIFYALMKLMEKDYPDEFKKMGSELEEPVNKILETIKEYEKVFA